MRRANRGFTLFEMLVVLLGIGLVVGLVITGLVAVVRGLVPPQDRAQG
jgi:type II secretory pathway pseudopilin PulG